MKEPWLLTSSILDLTWRIVALYGHSSYWIITLSRYIVPAQGSPEFRIVIAMWFVWTPLVVN
jgi:hypothetical protein